MKTILIQINDNRAYKLLEHLEGLGVLKILDQDVTSGPKLSEKYAGKLPIDVANELRRSIEKGYNGLG